MPETSRPPRLLTQVRRAARVRQFSRRTEEAYAAWVRRYVRFHGMRHPAELGAAEIEQFLAHLADRGLGASSRTQALSALLFLTGWCSGGSCRRRRSRGREGSAGCRWC